MVTRVLLAIASIVLVSGCSQPKAVYISTLSDAEYGDVVRRELPSLISVSDDALYRNASLVCSSFDVDMPYDELASIFTRTGLGDEAKTLIGLAITHRCPEYGRLLDASTRV